MSKQRKIKRLVIFIVTTIISAVICFFCFERIDQIVFFTILLDLFLLAQVVLFSGPPRLSEKARREILELQLKNAEKGNDTPTKV